jgi:hypothetical protein
MEESYSLPSIVPLIGDSHRYKTDKGEISLVYPSMFTFDLYEIYCVEGDLFDDTERYNSIEDAEERIESLLL